MYSDSTVFGGASSARTLTQISSILNHHADAVYNLAAKPSFRFYGLKAVGEDSAEFIMMVADPSIDPFSATCGEIALRHFLLSRLGLHDHVEVIKENEFYCGCRVRRTIAELATLLVQNELRKNPAIPPDAISVKTAGWDMTKYLLEELQSSSKVPAKKTGFFDEIKVEPGRLIVSLRAAAVWDPLDMILFSRAFERLLGLKVTYGGYPETDDFRICISGTPETVLAQLTPAVAAKPAV